MGRSAPHSPYSPSAHGRSESWGQTSPGPGCHLAVEAATGPPCMLVNL